MHGLRLVSLLSRPSPALRLRALPRKQFVSPSRALATLPDLPLFRALNRHNATDLAVIHSASSRSFTYGNLVADVLEQKERLAQTAGDKVAGERIAFLAENSYDYVGTVPL